MTATRDFYEVLAVDRTASLEEIKRAYRKLAIENHPDRNPGNQAAEEAFKEASQAYAVLSDAEKRARYDRVGHSAFNAGGGAEPVDFSAFADILEGLLGDILGGRNRKRPPRDMDCDLEISFEEAARGVEKTISVRRPMFCETCAGSGAEPGTPVDVCDACRGRGEVRYQRGFFSASRPCQLCHGTGKRIARACAQCKGEGVFSRDEELRVCVPPGVEHGAVRTLRGDTGDLHVHVRVQPHSLFTRQGADVLCTVPVSFPKATLGAEIEVPTLEGKVRMRVPAGTQPGKVFRLRGKGIPVFGGYGKGDQLVTVNVEVPEKVTRRQRQLIEELALELGADVEGQPQEKNFLEKLKTIFE